MKVLWIVNIVFPEICPSLKLPKTVIGGWLSSYRRILKKYYPNVQLFIISPFPGRTESKIAFEGDVFYVFPQCYYEKQREGYFLSLYNEIEPDVVHIHGTELQHSLSFVKACGTKRTLVSIQGLVSICTKYYFAGIKVSELISNITLRDILKCDTIYNRFNSFKERGTSEVALLKLVKNVAGRTTWDKANLLYLNPNVRYFKLDEVLRSPFYDNKWELARCQRHSIFLSQVNMPLKGLHIMLMALPIILNRYPDTEVFLCGDDYSLKPFYRRDGYWNYIASLIKKYKLKKHLHFLGCLDENTMVKHYLSAHVFVCPSSIENSSNSVCEAQILGVPVVASYVGGMMDLIDDGVTGLLYRFEEYSMLADKVCSIFEKDDFACSLSANSRISALERHDSKRIADRLFGIYTNLMEDK